MPKRSQPYGTWSSPLSARALSESLNLVDVQWDSDGGTLVWLENRGAKGVLVAQIEGQAPRDLTAEHNVRGMVGYGGGSFTAGHGRVIYAGPNGRLYSQALAGGGARPITPAFGQAAAPRLSPDGRWVIYVHSDEGVDGLAIVDAEGAHWPRKFAFGTDFVMQPAWHVAGEYLAWIAWDHPNMPWDGTELRLAALAYDRDGAPYAASVTTLAGGPETAIFQPEFSPDGRWLAYISDATGWNQLYVYDISNGTHQQITHAESDHGQPAWIQGVRVYGWTPDSHSLIYTENLQGFKTLYEVPVLRPGESGKPGQKASKAISPSLYSEFTQVAVSPRENRVAVIASAPKVPQRLITFDLDRPDVPPVLALDPSDQPTIQVIVQGASAAIARQAHTILRRTTTETLTDDELAGAEAISWPGHDGETVHGLLYRPTSARFESGGAPPLIVSVHGGPTSQVTAGYAAAAQFFATRGYAVLYVNHRGSTGYGKAYMNKLRGNWGLYDVEDSASGAAYLAEKGLADPGRFVIMGGSAGGYTVWQSLVSHPGFYRAGVCAFGISNQFTLASDTHKFEARYTDSLLGPLPEAAPLYRERSPIFHAERIVDPVIVFQGEDDKVVPRNQSDSIVASLKARGIPHEYHLYPGEGHGFRKPETLEHYYEAVIKFLKQYVIYF
jgi:dipeptidyl aminopeptidase/acylaminoacyl peptidase